MIQRPRPRPSIDGFGPRPNARPMPQLRPVVPVLRQPVVQPQPSFAQPPKQAERLGRHNRWQIAAVIAGGAVVGLVVQAIPLGYIAAILYGVVAVIKRVPSRTTFTFALGAPLGAPLGIAIGQAAVANGFSLISFLLLCVGVVTLASELKKERRSSET